MRVVFAQDAREVFDEELKVRLSSKEAIAVDLPDKMVDGGNGSPQTEDERIRWFRWLTELPPELLEDILFVCITDTMAPHTPFRSASSASAIRDACYRLRIPVNVADHPHLSDFHFPASYRFPLLSSSAFEQSSLSSPLQLAITTNAHSCRLATRIRREVISRLPKEVGSAVAKIGQLREAAKKVDDSNQRGHTLDAGEMEEGWPLNFLNKPVAQITAPTARSRCTSPNRIKRFGNLDYQIPLIPPLTPPPTPPSLSLMVDKMEQILAGTMPAAFPGLSDTITRMRFIAQICKQFLQTYFPKLTVILDS